MTKHNVQITLTKYEVLTTGVDGGHRYIFVDEFFYEGKRRSLAVFFESKSYERHLTVDTEIHLQGTLIVSSGDQLTLINAIIVE